MTAVVLSKCRTSSSFRLSLLVFTFSRWRLFGDAFSSLSAGSLSRLCQRSVLVFAGLSTLPSTRPCSALCCSLFSSLISSLLCSTPQPRLRLSRSSRATPTRALYSQLSSFDFHLAEKALRSLLKLREYSSSTRVYLNAIQQSPQVTSAKQSAATFACHYFALYVITEENDRRLPLPLYSCAPLSSSTGSSAHCSAISFLVLSSVHAV